ncbi:hypothetical protein RHCRD62_10076 [Rhodococcus sp. RD6.2]|uniref:helix-turn-helix transcriptional regulator n=1 Tax=Rhodococcus sp. RD6.2 TaxID=260936 RepID=UPI00063B7FEE|nr:helix-turn-helix domain-containing protein [Rhodococcus sp. RD6.2]CRK49221.1 hypothetical protein RHCRD62_10076 [Rhodococcus sp. RD6.2]
MPKRYLSLAQATDYTGLHERTLRRRIADGTLPAFRCGPRLIRVDQADLDGMFEPVTCTRRGTIKAVTERVEGGELA